MLKIALVGIGKIAADQHVPSINASEDWDLVATVSRSGTVDGIPAFTSIDDMLAEHPEVEVISLCLPPVPRFDYAAEAILSGRHVMIEKPPGATLAEVQELEAMAAEAGVTLFATWHSRMAKGVQAAKAALADRKVESGHITWHESVRKWHPDQDWVFDAGGMGVLDPGINALSILTEVLPNPIHLREGVLHIPEGRQTPIAGELTFTGGITMSLDWLKDSGETWEMRFTATDGTAVQLKDGGNVCLIDGEPQDGDELDEYPALYARMHDLVKLGKSDVDVAPMVHVSDAMTLARRDVAAPFNW